MGQQGFWDALSATRRAETGFASGLGETFRGRIFERCESKCMVKRFHGGHPRYEMRFETQLY